MHYLHLLIDHTAGDHHRRGQNNAEQRHLKLHAKLARQMGMDPRDILISDIGRVIELTPKTCKLGGTVTAGK